MPAAERRSMKRTLLLNKFRLLDVKVVFGGGLSSRHGSGIRRRIQQTHSPHLHHSKHTRSPLNRKKVRETRNGKT